MSGASFKAPINSSLYILLEPFDYKEWWLFCLTIENCRRPDDISNGSVIVQGGVSHGSAVTYRCDAGFTLSGTRQQTCNDGRWIPARPTCKGIIIVAIVIVIIISIIIVVVVVVVVVAIIIIITIIVIIIIIFTITIAYSLLSALILWLSQSPWKKCKVQTE